MQAYHRRRNPMPRNRTLDRFVFEYPDRWTEVSLIRNPGGYVEAELRVIPASVESDVELQIIIGGGNTVREAVRDLRNELKKESACA